jgi:nucleotide-binding universal stress UspA family protein
MLQQAIASKRRLPAGVANEITRLKRLDRIATGVESGLSISEMLSESALDSIASLTLQDAEKVAKAARSSTIDKALLKGDPAENILSVAKKRKADVIVLGRRGMGRLAGLLLGSVSQKVSQLAHCPVLTVK